jgi:hypothetical protein
MMMRRLVAVSTLSFAVWACDDTTILRVPDPEVHVDELKQKPAALVDILWVVDNSGSMVEEQNALAANFNRFITSLTLCQGTNTENDICDFNTKKCSVSNASCNPPDYHVGVISSDATNPIDQGKLRRVGLCVPSAGATPAGTKYRYCAGSNQECVHDASDPASDPSNNICDLANQGALAFVTPTTPNGANAFGRAVRVGVSGSGLEQGIRAAAQALGRDTDRATGQWIPAPTANAGFLRQNASLFIIFVSDEEDSTFGETTYFYRAFETLKGAGNEGAVSISAIVGDPDPDGDSEAARGGCPAPPMDPIAIAGNRFVSLAMYTRSLSAELRVCDDRRLTCPTGQACQKPVLGLPGVCVPTGACETDTDCGNFKCADGAGCAQCAANACTLPSTRFLELLGQTGIFGSICSPEYDVVLSKLGFEAAGLARKFGLTKNPDCTLKVKCCDDGVAAEACTEEQTVCVRVAGKVLPNDRATGWVYEPSSNSVFFDGDFIPPTDATISVSYRLSTAGEPLSCTSALN